MIEIISDAVALGYQVVRIEKSCRAVFNETLEIELESSQLALESEEISALGFAPNFPFNVTDCLQATTDFSALFGNLWYTLEAGQSTGNIINAVSKIVIDVEPLLRTCGESGVAEILAKQVPEACLVSISDIS
jgi:hypothetical protein